MLDSARLHSPWLSQAAFPLTDCLEATPTFSIPSPPPPAPLPPSLTQPINYLGMVADSARKPRAPLPTHRPQPHSWLSFQNAWSPPFRKFLENIRLLGGEIF